jgi:hypothetical protein
MDISLRSCLSASIATVTAATLVLAPSPQLSAPVPSAQVAAPTVRLAAEIQQLPPGSTAPTTLAGWIDRIVIPPSAGAPVPTPQFPPVVGGNSVGSTIVTAPEDTKATEPTASTKPTATTEPAATSEPASTPATAKVTAPDSVRSAGVQAQGEVRSAAADAKKVKADSTRPDRKARDESAPTTAGTQPHSRHPDRASNTDTEPGSHPPKGQDTSPANAG